ncbi:ECF transporter S component [Bacteroides sp.]|uniref:ECF transporter S component n=1 Tax=Bacteroides sp. TaxID=29523 RepID=UPI002604D17F|nr:ECF transporter S component [Bacteroides sp.]MDD3037668.1 ECF transporter S component [Bacteroides sp.]
METTTVKLYSLNYSEVKTYLAASLFVVGNILFPQLFHLISQGGVTWLPIYFFTLIGAYKYGWKVGLLTAILSPIINSLLFGMPMPVALPAILLKSILLAIAAGWAAQRFGRISIPILVGVVFSYQLVGTLGEWIYVGSFFKAIQDFRIGVPGMLLQVFGGYFFIKYLIRR